MSRRPKGGSASGSASGAGSSSSSGKGTSVSLSFDSNLRSSLAHLPPSMYHALVGRDIPPQSIVLQVARNGPQQTQDVGSDDEDQDEDSRPRHTVYLGWSGQCSNLDSTLTLSSSLRKLFQPAAIDGAGSSYTLTLLRSPPLPTATRVDLTPLTPDDWELLSQNAGAVEDNMLSQVRGVHRGGRVCIFVGRGGSQECWFKVDSTEPQTASDGSRTSPRAVRLMTNTEIVIAPRVRQSAAQAAAKEQHSIGGSTSTQDSQSVNAKLAARATLKHRIYKVASASGVPRGLQYDVQGDTPIAVVSGNSAEWQVISSAFASTADADWVKATIHIQPCPSAPSIRPTVGIKGGDEQEGGSQSTTSHYQPTTTAYIVRDDSVSQAASPRWVWFNTALRSKLGGRVGMGETFCFSAPPPGSNTSTAPPTSTDIEHSPLPTPTPSLAGVSSLLTTLETHFTTSISTSTLLGSSQNSNILLYGSSGTGKTSILHHLCSLPSITPLYIDCTPHSESRISQLKNTFQEWRDAVDWYSTRGVATILMLDNLDRVVIPEVENVDPTRARTIAELFVSALQGTQGIVLATANSNTATHKLLVEKHFWNSAVPVKSPGKGERAEILAHLVKLKVDKSVASGDMSDTPATPTPTPTPTLSADPSLNYIQLSSQTEGYLPADLVDLVDRAIYRAAVRTSGGAGVDSVYPSAPLTLTPTDFASAQENFTPLSLRSLSLSTSSVTWSSIGGLTETRRVLRETLEFPSRYAQIFASCPLRLRSGLLLYGYPGCGKTMLASAVAKECGANFVSVKGPEILNKYIGASEKSVRDLFERASSAKPCVLFFDEFDSIAPKRGHDSTGVTDRVVNQLLTQMDGAEGLDGVYVLAATSRPDLIDSALLRPGRLDKSLLCDMPSALDRKEILEAVVREGKIEVAGDVKWEEWVERLEGFSGADLQAFVYNAHLEVVHEGIAERESAGVDTTAEEKESPALRFVELNKGEKTTTRSKAQDQALRRRIEVALSNSSSSTSTTSSTSKLSSVTTKAKPRPSHVVTNAHLTKSLATMRPSVPASERARLQRIYRDFAGERSTEFKSADSASRDVGARESLM